MTETKITKKDVVNAIIALAEENDFSVKVGDVTVTSADIKTFGETFLAQAEKKAESAAKRALAKRAKGDELQATILGMLSDEPITADAIVAEIGDEEITKSKVVSRMTNLVKTGQAAKTTVKVGDSKRVAYTLPGATEVETEDAE